MNNSQDIITQILSSLKFDSALEFKFSSQDSFERNCSNVFDYAVEHNNKELLLWLFDKNHSNFFPPDNLLDKLVLATKDNPNHLMTILELITRKNMVVWSDRLYRKIISKTGEFLIQNHLPLNEKLIKIITHIPDVEVVEEGLNDIITHHSDAISIYEKINSEGRNFYYTSLFNTALRSGNSDYIRYFREKLTADEIEQSYFFTDAIFMLVLSNKSENIPLFNELFNIDLYSSYSQKLIHQCLDLGGKSLELVSHVYEKGGRYIASQNFFSLFVDLNDLLDNMSDNEVINCITSNILKYEPENLPFFIDKIKETNFPEIANIVLKISNKYHLDNTLNTNSEKTKSKMKI